MGQHISFCIGVVVGFIAAFILTQFVIVGSLVNRCDRVGQVTLNGSVYICAKRIHYEQKKR